jgi:hypothetical protein
MAIASAAKFGKMFYAVLCISESPGVQVKLLGRKSGSGGLW